LGGGGKSFFYAESFAFEAEGEGGAGWFVGHALKNGEDGFWGHGMCCMPSLFQGKNGGKGEGGRGVLACVHIEGQGFAFEVEGMLYLQLKVFHPFKVLCKVHGAGPGLQMPQQEGAQCVVSPAGVAPGRQQNVSQG